MGWEIFEVQPAADGRPIERMPEGFRSGWLCFQSPTERRRLAPIPPGWQHCEERDLRPHSSTISDVVRVSGIIAYTTSDAAMQTVTYQ